VCDFVHMRNSKFLQSNSDTEFVRELYKDYEIIEVQAPRRINCKGDSRGNVTELLIKNY
jgi:DNA adenine methylase